MDCDMIDNTTASQGRTPERKPDKLKSQKENIPSRGFNTEITVENLDSEKDFSNNNFSTLDVKINNKLIDSNQLVTELNQSYEDCVLSTCTDHILNSIDSQHQRRGRAQREKSLLSANLEREKRCKTENSFYTDMMEESPEFEKNRPQRTVMSNERSNTKYLQKITKNHKAKQNFQSTIKKANVFEFTLGKKVQSEPRIPASERFNIVTKRLKIKVKFDDGGSKKAQFELSNKLYDELTEEKEQRNYNNFRIEQHDSRISSKYLNDLISKRGEENKAIRSIKNLKYNCNELTNSQLISLKQEIMSKKLMAESIKQKSNILKCELQKSNQIKSQFKYEEKRDNMKCEDMIEYIERLKTIKKTLSMRTKIGFNNDKLESIAKNREDSIIDLLDSKGQSLNRKLKNIINTIDQKEQNLSDKIDSVNSKINSRAIIKEKCCEIDSKVTSLAESASNSTELLLKDLIRIIKYKNTLKGNINKLSIGLEELKIVARGIEFENTVMKSEAKELYTQAVNRLESK